MLESIIEPKDLLGIKTRAMDLDLAEVEQEFAQELCSKCDTFRASDVLCKSEMKACGIDSDEEVDILEAFFEEEGFQSALEFAPKVSTEYRRLLVLKCIEIIAAANTTIDDKNPWKESSKPRSSLVEMFWQAHYKSNPSQYIQDCRTVLGGTLSEVDTTTVAATIKNNIDAAVKNSNEKKSIHERVWALERFRKKYDCIFKLDEQSSEDKYWARILSVEEITDIAKKHWRDSVRESAIAID